MLLRHAFCRRLGVRFTALLTILSILLAAGVTLAQSAPQGTLRVGLEIPAQLDPAFASSDSEIAVLNSIYDYLVDVDAANEVQPRLAREWTVSDDGLAYTFQLADTTFHDGSPLTAADVVYTFERLRDPELGSPTSDLYANIAGIEASGEREVTFTLEQPNPFFLFDLSDNHALVVQEDAADLGAAFNGTGPFRVESYAPEDRMELSANPDYFIEGKPGVETLELVFFSDQSAAVSAIRGGQLDLVLRMPTPLYESLANARGVERVSVPTNAFDLVRLRTDREPGSDPRVVEALKRAVDRQAIAEVVTQGLAAPGVDTPIGPLYERYHLDEPGLPAFDPEAARELLAEAGYPDGLELQLYTPDSGDRPDLAQVLQQQLAAAGFQVEIVVVPESVYYSDAPNNWLDATFGITGWGSRPVPQFYLEVMVACDAKWNEAHYCNERVDELIREAGTVQDDEARAEAYAEIQRILAAEGPYVIPYFFPQFAALREGFSGLELKAFPGRTDLAAVQAP